MKTQHYLERPFMPEKTAEQLRVEEGRKEIVAPWLMWGPYVSERAWGTVREDYSQDGNSWNYFPYEMAASRAYRWGEDGIAAFCDRYQVLVFAPAFWNGRDSHLKERFYGLSLFDGNHGEDVKELYYHLDGLPSHAYMKFLYKYPQSPFPYERLREENRRRSTDEPEFELADSGAFDESRYFDITIEYAKRDPRDFFIKLEAKNRGPDKAALHLLQQVFFRNQWSWSEREQPKPLISSCGEMALEIDEREMPLIANLPLEYRIGKHYFYGPEGGELLFTENETGKKDAFHRKIVGGEALEKSQGSKAALHYTFDTVLPGEAVTLFFRVSPKPIENPLEGAEALFQKRKAEADAFYASIHPKSCAEDEKLIQRQALAGMVWSKQIYIFDVNRWLKGDNSENPPPEERMGGRNSHWKHVDTMRVMLMPDKWEYPWFAAWDHAFHCITYALIDREFAKKQLWLLLFDQFQHPNGQIPAYEWDFSDLNPPVQAWALFRLYKMEERETGRGDRDFLEKCFHKLLLNFTWWVNKVDNSGNNVFEGGFLGLDNITVLDRSETLPGGAILQQSDGTGWMAMFTLNLMRIALELSRDNQVYEGLATKFFQHYVYIAHAMKKRGNRDYEMWSERDGFFYDVLTYPDGTFTKFRVRSLVGLIPLFAVEILHEESIKHYKEFYSNFQWFMNNRKDLVEPCIIPTIKEGKKHYICTLMNRHQLKSVLKYVWDPAEFRGRYGLRSMSRFHEKHPFVFEGKSVGYEPAESLHRVKGGNSNWRGPIWMPTTFLLVESLSKLNEAFEEGISIQIEGEEPVDISSMGRAFADRAIALFKADESGHRPIFGQSSFQGDPYFKDHLLFYEYYNPETGKGLGSSHQTGWSALVANFIQEFR